MRVLFERLSSLVRIVNLSSRRPFLLSFLQKTRSVFCGKSKNIHFDGAPVKAPPATRRKATQPIPQQGPPPPPEGTPLPTWPTWPDPPPKSAAEGTKMEEEDQEYCSCGMEYGGEHWWAERDRTGIVRMEQYLDET